MTELSGQEFFEIHGYYPTIAAPPRKQKLSSPSNGGHLAALQQGRHLALRGWRQPLHWTVPPPFEHPGLIYSEIGHEAFLEVVKEYWQSIKEYKCEQAQRAHTKWAIRQILSKFETHVRGFRKQSVSRRGGLHSVASDELVLPETLLENDKYGPTGYIMAYLHRHLRAYGVPGAEWPAVERLVRTKLELKWGVQA